MGGGGFLNNMITMFTDMFDKLLALAPELLAAILDLLSAVFEQHGGTIIKYGSIYLGFIFTKMMITAALSSLKGAIIGKIAGMFSKSVGGVSKKIKPPEGPPGGEKGGFLDKLKDFVKSIGEISAKDILMAGDHPLGMARRARRIQNCGVVLCFRALLGHIEHSTLSRQVIQ